MADMKLWGEIGNLAISPELDVTSDINSVLENVMNASIIEDYEAENSVCNDECQDTILNPMDEIMLYSISLHKFAAEITEAIQVVELTIESNVKILQSNDGQGIPEIPQPPSIFYTHTTNNLNFLPMIKTPFTQGEVVVYPELSRPVAKKILMQSVATMFAHIGYESTQNGILALLTDLLEEFIQKLCLRMKVAYDEENATTGQSGFPDCAEKVLVEFGINGCEGIHEYYQERIMKYTNTLYKRCVKLVDYYQSLMRSKDDSAEKHIFTLNTDDEQEGIDFQIHPSFEDLSEYDPQNIGHPLFQNLEAEAVFGDVVEDELTQIITSSNKKKRTK